MDETKLTLEQVTALLMVMVENFAEALEYDIEETVISVRANGNEVADITVQQIVNQARKLLSIGEPK